MEPWSHLGSGVVLCWTFQDLDTVLLLPASSAKGGRSFSFPTSASTLVHAFIVNRLFSLYVGLMARGMKVAARLVGCISRFGHVSEYMHYVLHWLPLQQTLGSPLLSGTVYWAEPRCICKCSSLKLRLVRVALPCACTTIMKLGAFSVVKPSVWNGLPPDLCSLPSDLSGAFYQYLKTYLFDWAWIESTSE